MKWISFALAGSLLVAGVVAPPRVADLVISEAVAAGSGGGGRRCKKGETYSRRKRECVPANSASVDRDSLDSIYETGEALAYNGQYAEAIEVLWLADGREDARVLNMLGYSNRMLGRVDIGLAYYRQAISMDPDYTLVREYYGEGLLQKGDLDGALAELGQLKRLCGIDCSEYRELAQAIANHEAEL